MTHDPNPDGARDDDASEPEPQADTQEAENDVTETTETIENETNASATIDVPATDDVDTSSGSDEDEVLADSLIETVVEEAVEEAAEEAIEEADRRRGGRGSYRRGRRSRRWWRRRSTKRSSRKPSKRRSRKPSSRRSPPRSSRPPRPYAGPGDWYVVHTYAGYENKVKTNLESRIHTMQMEGKIFNVHIPMEDVMEIKGGKKQVVQKKVFPGYLLVKMIYDNDSWYVVRNTPGVTGFVSAGTGSKPTPLSRREVEKILVVKKEEVKPQFRLGFEEGDMVRIISGPFADFNGTISEINVDQSKLKVLVNIFDRETPVELGFDQVAKV